MRKHLVAFGFVLFCNFAFGAPGDLDPLFGSGGKATFTFPASVDEAHAVALQSDGKSVVVGRSDDAFVIARYLTNGVLDSTFGHGGRTRIGFQEIDFANAVAVQSDGKIVVVGGSVVFGDAWFGTYDSTRIMAIARLNSDGSLDSAFANNGKLLVTSAGEASCVVIQPDGKIVVGGPKNFSYTIVRLNSNGTYDSTFGGGDGIVNPDLFQERVDGDFSLMDLALQPDGKIVGAGGFEDTGDYALPNGFTAFRLNTDGAPDSTFGNGGYLQIVPPEQYDSGYPNEAAGAVAIQSDGKILLGGMINYYFGLVRLNANGALDSTFGSGGIAALVGENYAGAVRDILVQPDNRIVAAGFVDRGAIARFNANGSLDSTFNGTGILLIDGSARGVVRQSDTKLVIAGTLDEQVQLTRLSASGSYDTTYSSDGKVTEALFRESDVKAAAFVPVLNEMVSAGSAGDRIALSRVATNGAVTGQRVFEFLHGWQSSANAIVVEPGTYDVALTIAGSVTGEGRSHFAVGETFLNLGDLRSAVIDFGANNSSANALALQSDNYVVMAGYAGNGANYDFALARGTFPSGHLFTIDGSFGTAGKVTTAIGSSDDVAYAIALQSDGKIVVGGYTLNSAGTAGDFALVRYLANGTLDSSFGSGGKVVTSIGAGYDEIHAIAIQNDGKIVVAGTTQISGGSYDTVVARYTTSGVLDTSFSGDGIATLSFGSGAETATGIYIDLNGRILVSATGNGATAYGVAAFNVNGTPDSTFGIGGKVTGNWGGSSCGARAITEQSDRKIVIGGINTRNGVAESALARFEKVAAPTLNLNSATWSTNENSSPAAIDLTLNGGSAQMVTVNFSTRNGTAVAGDDYTAVSSKVTFQPYETNKTVSVPIINDTLSESNETIQIALSAPINATFATPSAATLTIVDNDPLPSIQLDPANIYSVNENSGNASISVRLSQPSGKTVSVNFATANGTAVAGSDYSSTNGTLTFLPGEMFKTIQVPILDDSIDESTESFSFNLSSASNATLGTSSAVVTIQDGDAPAVSFQSAALSVNESWFLSIPVTLSFPATQTTTVNYATANGTATAGSDYIATNGTVTFAPGETNKYISVTINGDSTNEPNETLSVNLSAPSHCVLGSHSTLQLTVIDSSRPPSVSFRQITLDPDGTAHTGESNFFSFVLDLSKSWTQTVSVVVSSVPGTATAGSDYNGSSQTLVFNPGTTAKSGSISILTDTIYEGNETFNLVMTSATNSTIDGLTNMAVTIVDDEAPPTVAIVDPVFTFFGVPISENTNLLTVTVRRTPPANVTSTVNFSTYPVYAVAGVDFVPTNGTLSFGPGETNKTFSVQVLNNSVFETNKTFSVGLSQATNAQVPSFANNLLSIVDDDPPPAISFSTNNFVVDEDAGVASLTVVLDTASQATTAVNVAVSPLTASSNTDFVSTNLTLTFAPGEVSQSFDVSILSDAIDEADETIQLTLSNPVNGTLGSVSNSILTILDANPSPVLSLDTNNYVVAESVGTITAQVRLNAVSGRPVSVAYSTVAQTAGTNDFSSVGGTLIFNPGEINKTIVINITNDAQVELNETFQLALTSPTNAAILGDSLVTIMDDDTPVVGFQTNNVFVAETSPSASVNVTLSAASGRTVSVRLVSTNGTATDAIDYFGVNTLLTFNPGETNKQVLVPILDDALEETNETILLSLTDSTNATVAGTSLITILDNEPPEISFMTNAYNVNEVGGSVLITVRLSYPHDQTVFVDFATSDGTAQAGSDYAAAGGTLVFAPGQVSKTFPVTIFNDSLVEGNETVQLTLSEPVGGVAGAITSAILTIADDDYVKLSIVPSLNRLDLLWPTSSVGFTLQSSSNLLTSGWTVVTNSISVTNGSNSVNIVPSTGPNFFRLRR